MPPAPRPATVSGVAPPGLRIPTDVTYADLLVMLARDLGDPDIAAGPKGDPGEQGIQGIQGLQGDPGVDAAAPGPWAAIAFGAGWSNLDAIVYGVCEQRVEGDVVRLRGIAQSDDQPIAGELVFTLPNDRLPIHTRGVPALSSNSPSTYLYPQPNGEVAFQWFGAQPVGVSVVLLDGVLIPL